MSKHRGKKKQTTVGHRCECYDPDCPTGHGSKRCQRRNAHKLQSLSYGDYVYFCRKCGEDALASGVFG